MPTRPTETRLLLAVNTWREMTDEPLPKLAPGSAESQLEDLELRLVKLLCEDATSANAREVADRTWELVYDRPDDDRVKRLVVECHERLAKLVAPTDVPPPRGLGRTDAP